MNKLFTNEKKSKKFTKQELPVINHEIILPNNGLRQLNRHSPSPRTRRFSDSINRLGNALESQKKARFIPDERARMNIMIRDTLFEKSHAQDQLYQQQQKDVVQRREKQINQLQDAEVQKSSTKQPQSPLLQQQHETKPIITTSQRLMIQEQQNRNQREQMIQKYEAPSTYNSVQPRPHVQRSDMTESISDYRPVSMSSQSPLPQKQEQRQQQRLNDQQLKQRRERLLQLVQGKRKQLKELHGSRVVAKDSNKQQNTTQQQKTVESQIQNNWLQQLSSYTKSQESIKAQIISPHKQLAVQSQHDYLITTSTQTDITYQQLQTNQLYNSNQEYQNNPSQQCQSQKQSINQSQMLSNQQIYSQLNSQTSNLIPCNHSIYFANEQILNKRLKQQHEQYNPYLDQQITTNRNLYRQKPANIRRQ